MGCARGRRRTRGVVGPGHGGEQPPGTETLEERNAAVVSTASLQLKVQTATCVANQALDFFQITNTGSTGVKLSDIKIR